jgi:purine-cytosine permease-like protein
MIGVKITVLLIALTVIWWFIVKILVSGESMEKKIGIAMNNEVTWYMVMFALLVISSVIGLLYSLVYLLFLR